MRRCITHHFACDCREEKFEKVIEAAKHIIKINKNGVISAFSDRVFDNLEQTIKEFEK